jgi:hypothetical protein
MIDRQHLRAISRTAGFSFPYTGSPFADPVPASGGGGVVPANKLRTIYWIKISHDNATKQLVELWSNGVTGTIVLDKLQVPGYGTNSNIGDRCLMLGKDLEEPVYTLTEGQQIGASIGAGTCYVTYCYYDESG